MSAETRPREAAAAWGEGNGARELIREMVKYRGLQQPRET